MTSFTVYVLLTCLHKGEYHSSAMAISDYRAGLRGRSILRRFIQQKQQLSFRISSFDELRFCQLHC